MKKLILFISFGFISLHANNLNITVSILPQKYFVEQIAADKVNVNVMVRAGFSPATYEPQTSQMKALAHSHVYFSIGVPFENAWLEKFESANKLMKIVDTSRDISKLKMAEHEHHEENHDEEHEGEHHDEEHEGEHHDEEHEGEHHDEEHEGEHHDEKHEKEHHDEDIHTDGLDPHVWLDPILVKSQAKIIYNTLVQMDKENEDFYTKNYHSFLISLDDLNNKLASKLKSVSKSAFMVFHPSWGYFAKRYDLKQIVVEKEGKEPKPRELIELINEAKEHNIKVIFVSPQFSQKAAKTIAKSIKGVAVSIDHLAYNYPVSLINNAQAIYDSYKK